MLLFTKCILMPRCFQFQNAPFLFSSYFGFLAHFTSVFVSLYIHDSPHKKVISSAVKLWLCLLSQKEWSIIPLKSYLLKFLVKLYITFVSCTVMQWYILSVIVRHIPTVLHLYCYTLILPLKKNHLIYSIQYVSGLIYVYKHIVK